MTLFWMPFAGTVLQLAMGLAMALGSIGHSVYSGPRMAAELGSSHLAVERQVLIMVVWHFAGGCMALMGSTVVAAVWIRQLSLAAWLVAAFYALFGVAAGVWSGQRFFFVFAVLGVGALGAMGLRGLAG
ncbi:MAG: hypothetical protein KF796_20360 [Ramlibacter sp.]|nr:hypothetical protein [Ramlibacter sp.]